MHETIYDLVESKNLLEAKCPLTIIDEYLAQNTVNRPQFCKQLSQAIVEWSIMSRPDIFNLEADSRYHIYSVLDSIPPYLAAFGLSLGRVREVRQRIKSLLSCIDETIVEPSGVFLPELQEEKILTILATKFPYLEIVTAKKPLTILNINNTHRIYNSQCGTNEAVTAFVIQMFNMKDASFVPEYVFLHELGHALHLAITGSVLIVPDEFIKFNNSIPGALHLEQGSIDAPELFADTFAIAVMRGTELSGFDPFHFDDTLNGMLEMFFTKMFERWVG